MNPNNLIFKKINFSHSDNYRKLDSIFRNWFSDPKTLNFVSPNASYPFNMKDWVKKNYSDQRCDIVSVAACSKEWVIGYGSISINKNFAHLFHIIVDKKHRYKGLGSAIIDKLEKIGEMNNKNTFTINVVKKKIKSQLIFIKNLDTK